MEKGIDSGVRYRMTESNIFFRCLHFGVQDNGETRVIENETTRGNKGGRGGKGVAAMLTKEALFSKTEKSGAAGNGRKSDQGRLRSMFNDKRTEINSLAERTD